MLPKCRSSFLRLVLDQRRQKGITGGFEKSHLNGCD
jgi:hypothetical protein